MTNNLSGAFMCMVATRRLTWKNLEVQKKSLCVGAGKKHKCCRWEKVT